MKALVGKALLAIAVAAALANPPRRPLKVCGCGTSNEPDRTTCIGCGGQL
ncbi:MAG: hypothetical protein ACRDP6_24640 [Actinoallomurus sp.]